MTANQDALFVGLRRSPLEWRAEIEAANELGFVVHATSDGDLSSVALPKAQTTRFAWGGGAAAVAERILAGLACKPALVACWGDRFVEVTARVATALSLRSVGPEAGAICCDKAAQRRVLEPLGLNPRWRTGTTREELDRAVAELQGPLVFKVAHASGGLGLSLLDGRQDLSEVLSATSANYIDSRAFVVEKLVVGSEHSAAGVVSNGEPVVFAIADKTLEEGSFFTHTTVVPSALGSEQVESLRSAAARAVRAVGIRDGGFHVDLKLGERGPIVLEVGARLGGDLINSHLIPMATGGACQPYKALIHALASGSAPPAVRDYTSRVAMLLLPIAGGALERAKSHPLVRTAAEWPSDRPDVFSVTLEATPHEPLAAVISDFVAWLRR